MPRIVYESEIERKVVALALIDYGVSSIKLQKTRGYPDRQFFIPGGKPLFIEFKRKGGILSNIQKSVHAKLRAAGYRVDVHDDVDEALLAIKGLLP